ncbi:MAG: hypothetical protein LUG93_06845 [Lachnospiraceae bacterium]|nr:hypothetical protein [Lachnospiraceae bacterium]
MKKQPVRIYPLKAVFSFWDGVLSASGARPAPTEAKRRERPISHRHMTRKRHIACEAGGLRPVVSNVRKQNNSKTKKQPVRIYPLKAVFSQNNHSDLLLSSSVFIPAECLRISSFMALTSSMSLHLSVAVVISQAINCICLSVIVVTISFPPF